MPHVPDDPWFASCGTNTPVCGHVPDDPWFASCGTNTPVCADLARTLFTPHAHAAHQREGVALRDHAWSHAEVEHHAPVFDVILEVHVRGAWCERFRDLRECEVVRRGQADGVSAHQAAHDGVGADAAIVVVRSAEDSRREERGAGPGSTGRRTCRGCGGSRRRSARRFPTRVVEADRAPTDTGATRSVSRRLGLRRARGPRCRWCASACSFPTCSSR